MHYHLLKHRVLDYEVLGDSYMRNIYLILSGLLNWEKNVGVRIQTPQDSYSKNKRYSQYNLEVDLSATITIFFWGASESKRCHT